LESAQRPRGLRKPFVAAILITDVASDQQVSARTSDLSTHGCFVLTTLPMKPGGKVQITIVYAGVKVVAFGHVVSAHAGGMGIAFTKVEARDQAVIDGWLNDLRGT
jgi:hypothetical protein